MDLRRQPTLIAAILLVPVALALTSGEAFESIVYRVADHDLGAPETGWIAAFEKAGARQQARYADAERTAAQARDSASRPLEKYAGTYRDECTATSSSSSSPARS